MKSPELIHTQPNIDRNFEEWHKGCERYGFWCVMIENDEWQTLVAGFQQRLGSFLHKDYLRAPHITTFALGLYTEEIEQIAAKQGELLRALKPGQLRLELKTFDSFRHCPIFEVSETTSNLKKIRDCLASVSKEDRYDTFRPHITLGLYDDEYAFKDVIASIKDIEINPQPLEIRELCFCTYSTQSIKGPIEVVERISLVE